jgi:hypothetical protein
MDYSTGIWLIGAVLVAFCAVYFVARNERIKRRILCPRRQQLADIEVVRRYESKEPVRVRMCSLFDDPERVTCPQDCLKIV